MKKKLVIIGLVMVMCLGIFSGCSGNVGKFYTLTEAYENGWLTQNDLRNIAYHYQGSTYDGFEPSPKNPEVLSEETKTKIKRTYLSEVKEDYPFAGLSGIHIVEYYGTYGDCVAVYVKDDYRIIDVFVIPEMEVGGVTFFKMTKPGLMIWKENQ